MGRGHERAAQAQSFAERAQDQVGAHAYLDTSAAGAGHADGMGFIDVEPCVVRVGERSEPLERGEIPIHREDAVGDDPRAAPFRSMRVQEPLEMRCVRVVVDVHHRAAQAQAVDQARVVQAIAERDVASTEHGGEHAEVGRISAREEECVGHPDELGEASLGRSVNGVRSRDQARGA